MIMKISKNAILSEIDWNELEKLEIKYFFILMSLKISN